LRCLSHDTSSFWGSFVWFLLANLGKEFDLDMDGEINEQEFINIMTDGA
jgi:hypothetical protein